MQAGEEVQAGPPRLPQATPFQASWHTSTQRDSALPAQHPMGVGVLPSRALVISALFSNPFVTDFAFHPGLGHITLRPGHRPGHPGPEEAPLALGLSTARAQRLRKEPSCKPSL